MAKNASKARAKRGGKRTKTRDRDESETPDDDVAGSELDLVENPDAATVEESAESPAWELPAQFAEERGEADDDPDPWASKWTIVLFRNDSGGGSTRRWKQVGIYSDEPFATWQTDPPVERVRHDFGPGYYRFDVRVGSQYLRMDAFPNVGGARSFEVADPNAPATPPGQYQQPQQQPSNGSPGISLDVNGLLAAALSGNRHQQNNGGGGLTVELAAKILDAAKTADEVKGKLERISERADERREAEREERQKLRETIMAQNATIDKIDTRLKSIEDKDPIDVARKMHEQAKAMGYEKEGWTGVAQSAVDAFFANGGLPGRGAPAPGGLAAAPAPMQQIPTQSNPAPSGNGQQNANDWRTAEDGAWLNVGEWSEWVLAKIERRQPTPTFLICDELVSRLLNDQRAAEWMKGASVDDVFELFKWVRPDIDVAQLTELRGEAQNILGMFPTRYKAAEEQLHELQRQQQQQQQTPAAATVAPTNLRPRGATPPPPPPPPPGR